MYLLTSEGHNTRLSGIHDHPDGLKSAYNIIADNVKHGRLHRTCQFAEWISVLTVLVRQPDSLVEVSTHRDVSETVYCSATQC